jgi:hypothetical protein
MRNATARAAVILTVVPILLGAAVADADEATATSSRCERGHAMLAAPGGDAYSGGGMSGVEHTYICAYATGKGVEIGKAGDPEASSEGGEGPTVQRLAFAGGFAGVVYTDEDGKRELQVVDLANGRVRFAHGLGGGDTSGIPGEYSEAGQKQVGAIVLERDGSVAWTEQETRKRGYDVLAHDRDGTATLDGTMRTVGGSLTLTGSTLHWRWHDGASHSAPLH